MKKVIISIVATLLVLVVLAQMGVLERFGIHGLSFDRKNEEKEKGAQSSSAADTYTDTDNDISYRVKCEGDYFLFYEEGEWKQEFMAGVNIGATEPGLFPGDLSIDYDTYMRWFKEISEMNCNCIRVYTLMRPQFYSALADFNADAENPLYLFQGVWLNEDDISSISDAYAENEKILGDFKNDCLTLVDVVHGNAAVAESPGEASGKYTADVSSWMAGWIIGIEWDPNFVMNTNDQNGDKTDYSGTYLYTQSASAFEAFLCQVGDALITHESEDYKYQTPLAFANWITTDPLSHPNEPHYDEDKAIVYTENIKSRNFAPSMFASYHIYPYYPDSLNYQEDYLNYIDESGKVNTYRAYLEDLKLAHTMPILVAEFGVPTSRGLGHESVMGYNQGRVDETKQGEMITDMIDSIYNADYAGALAFTWQDEWFKRTWNNVMFDIADRRPFWSNIQTTEQNFGILAFDPGETTCFSYPDGDVGEWEKTKAIVTNDAGELRVSSDERYVYLYVNCPDSYDFNNDKLYIPINTIGDQGNTESKADKLKFDTAADFLISIHGKDDSHIYVDAYYDAFYYHFIKSGILVDFAKEPDNEKKNSGVFNEMRMTYGYNLKVGSTGEEVKDKVYETGLLQFGNGNPNGENYTSLTDFCYLDGKLEIRIPWQLLNVMDPSSKQQIDDFNSLSVITEKPYGDFNFGLGISKGGNEALEIQLTGKYTNNTWTLPTWHERLKPAFNDIQAYLAELKTR